MAEKLYDTFWSPPPALPSGLELVRLERVVAARRGPGGQAVDDVAELRWQGGSVRLLIEYKAPVLARDVPLIRRRLAEAAESWRRLTPGQPLAVLLPALATDGATPSLIDACLAEGLAVLDRRGTVIVRAPGVFVHLEGKGKVPTAKQPRGSMFRGVSARVIRLLLAKPGVPLTAQSIAAAVDAGYATTFGALARLEKEGFVARESPRSGFVLRDPVRLLRSWIDSGERTAVAVDAYYSPAVSPDALARGEAALREASVKGIWTLASALLPSEVHVSGLPHGIYLAGSAAPLERALQLRRVTPHNFLVLRAEPAAETAAGGIYTEPRQLAHGPGVFLPQLAIDCAGTGGRGPEQARFLLERYGEAIRRGEA